MIKLFFNTVGLFLLVSCGYALSSASVYKTGRFVIGADSDRNLIVTYIDPSSRRVSKKLKEDPTLVDRILSRGTLIDVRNLFERAREVEHEIDLVDYMKGKCEVSYSLLNLAQAPSIDTVAKINYLMPMYTDNDLEKVLREPQSRGSRFLVDDIFFTLINQLEDGIYDKEFVDNVLRLVRLSPSGPSGEIAVIANNRGFTTKRFDNEDLPRVLSGLKKMSRDPRYKDLLKEVLKKSRERDCSEDLFLEGKSLGQLLVEKYPDIQLPSLDEAAASSSPSDAASSNMARHRVSSRVASAVARRGISGLLEDEVIAERFFPK